MKTHIKEVVIREEPPENYQNPGKSAPVAELGPTTRELLNLLSNIETGIAA